MWLLLKLLKHPPENSVLRESRNVERPYRTSEPYETGASPKGALTERCPKASPGNLPGLLLRRCTRFC